MSIQIPVRYDPVKLGDFGKCNVPEMLCSRHFSSSDVFMPSFGLGFVRYLKNLFAYFSVVHLLCQFFLLFE